MAKESAQQDGIDGVHTIKQWLESTTRYQFHWTAYDNETVCTIQCLDGSEKTMDMYGHTIPAWDSDEPKRPVYVECKNYTGAGGQGPAFKAFVATAYSNTALYYEKKKKDPENEFIWVTYHPFSQGEWNRLLTVEYFKECFDEFPDLLKDHEINHDLVSKVVERTSVLVVHQRQIDRSLTKFELKAFEVGLAHITGKK